MITLRNTLNTVALIALLGPLIQGSARADPTQAVSCIVEKRQLAARAAELEVLASSRAGAAKCFQAYMSKYRENLELFDPNCDAVTKGLTAADYAENAKKFLAHAAVALDGSEACLSEPAADHSSYTSEEMVAFGSSALLVIGGGLLFGNAYSEWRTYKTEFVRYKETLPAAKDGDASESLDHRNASEQAETDMVLSLVAGGACAVVGLAITAVTMSLGPSAANHTGPRSKTAPTVGVWLGESGGTEAGTVVSWQW